jgi:O-antigen ligase
MYKSGWLWLPAVFFFVLNFFISTEKILYAGCLLYILSLILIFYCCRNYKLATLLKPIITCSAIIIFIYGIVQKYILFPQYLETIGQFQGDYAQSILHIVKRGRVFSIFALPTLYAVICVIAILFFFHYLVQSKKYKYLWGLGIGLGVFNLILTQSFGGIIYLLGGIVFYLFLSQIIRFRYLAPIIMGLLLVVFLITGLRFAEAKQLTPLKLRLQNWTQAGRMITDHLLFGVGLGNYESHVSQFIPAGEVESIYAHNFILQFLAENGILLTFFLLLLLANFLSKEGLRIIMTSQNILYLTILLVLLLYNSIDIGFYFFPAGILFSICLAQLYYRPAPLNKPLLLAIASILTILLFMTVSDGFQKQAEYFTAIDQPEKAFNNYQKSLKINPWNIHSLSGLTRYHFLRNEFALCRQNAEHLLTLFPNSPFAHYIYSRLELNDKKPISALYHANLAQQLKIKSLLYQQWYKQLTNLILQVKPNGFKNLD